MTGKRLSRLLWLCLGLGLAGVAPTFTIAADMTLKVVDKNPPAEIDPSFRSAVQTKVVQVFAGETCAFEVWLPEVIPLKEQPGSLAKGLAAIEQLTFLGIARVSEGYRDYKDNEIDPGIYTARLAILPEDGDHLGTSDYPYFALLIPPAHDQGIGAISSTRRMVKASGRDTATGHPVVIGLRPVASEDGDLPRLTQPAETHKAVRVRVPAKAGETAVSLVFDVVYEGKGNT